MEKKIYHFIAFVGFIFTAITTGSAHAQIACQNTCRDAASRGYEKCQNRPSKQGCRDKVQEKYLSCWDDCERTHNLK